MRKGKEQNEKKKKERKEKGEGKRKEKKRRGKHREVIVLTLNIVWICHVAQHRIHVYITL